MSEEWHKSIIDDDDNRFPNKEISVTWWNRTIAGAESGVVPFKFPPPTPFDTMSTWRNFFT